MADEPEIIVLREIRELRREHLLGQEAISASLNHLRSFADTLNALAHEFEMFRVDARTALRDIRSDLLLSDNGALNRHTELLKAIERIRELEQSLPQRFPAGH